MNLKLISFIWVCFVGSLSVKAEVIKIKGTLKNTKANYLVFYQYFGPEYFALDTIPLKGEEFSYKIDVEKKPTGLYRLGFSEQLSIPVFVENTSLELTLDELDFVKGSKVLGSKANDDYASYIRFNEHYTKTLQGLEQTYQQIAKTQNSQPEVFQQKLAELRSSLGALNVERTETYKKLSEETESPYLKEMFGIMVIPSEVSKLSFFNAEEFKNDHFVYGDALDNKIKMYFMHFGTVNAQNLNEELGQVLSLAPQKTKSRDVTFYSLTRIASSIDVKFARKLNKVHLEEYPASDLALKMKKALPKGPPEIGDEAREIVMPNPEGTIIKLSSLRGKVVLLDFWASWCGPCRRESPNVVRAYHKYKDKGFTVYSVSLDKDKNRWLGAIQQDALTWPNHVSDLKHWHSQAARDYQVSGIPAMFLIDENGIIVGKNLRGEALFKKLEELYAK